MGKVSTARMVGIAAKVAGRQVKKTRTFAAVMNGCRATAVHCGRVLGQLWLEVTGFVFLALASIGGLAFVREYGKYKAGHSNSSRLALAIGFAVLFGWFGVSSFWRVRRNHAGWRRQQNQSR